MKKRVTYTVLVVVFLTGLSLLLYPVISNAYNTWLQSKAIVEYAEQVDQLAKEVAEAELAKAHAFNQSLLERSDPFRLTEEQTAQYPDLLHVTTQDIMAYVEIPVVDVMLPIAHGTSDDTLKDKIGHLEWSSLPVGGENTHSVVSGHRGLPSSELFTNIDHLELGDKFYIHALGQTLEYQVCNIVVVEPSDQRFLRIEEGKDLVTLITCTPYGINSHRLLVQGIRTSSDTNAVVEKVRVKNEITFIDILVLVSVILVIVAAVAFVVLMFSNKKKGDKRNDPAENN